MGLINVYNTISNEHTEHHLNGKIKDIYKTLNIVHGVTIKEGNKLSEDYEVTENDILYIRVVPSAEVIIPAIMVTAVVAAAALTVGCATYAVVVTETDKKTEAAKEEMLKAQKVAQEEAEKKAKNLASKVDILPFIRGSKNVASLGRAVQFVMGSVYNTPYLVTNGFYTLDGDNGKDIYYNAILDLGYNPQKITEIRLGDNYLIKNSNGITGVNSFDSGSFYYDSRNRIEISNGNNELNSSYFKQKVVCITDSSEIKHEYGGTAEPVIKQLAENTQKVEICIQFNGLRQYDNDLNTWVPCGVNINAEWTNDDGANWHSIPWNVQQAENFNFYLNSKQTVRFLATKTFSAAEAYGKNINIRLTRTNPKHESNSNEDAYLLYYQSYCYDKSKSSNSSLVPCKVVEDKLLNTCRMGVRIIANASTQDILDEFHVLTTGCARTFNGNTLSTDKKPTRNPAAWLLEVLTSDTHKHSKYNDNEIDLNSFATLYQYCEQNNFYTDGIVSENVKKVDLIKSLLETVNSALIINSDGLLEVVIDKEEVTPVAMINAENIISSTYSKNFDIKPVGARVTFVNRDTWQPDTTKILLPSAKGDETDILSEYNLSYITTYQHAYKYIQRRLRMMKLNPYSIQVNVGREGDYYPLFSTVLLQLKQFKQGIASSVITGVTTEGNNITGFTISDLIDLDPQYRYGVIIQAQTDAGKKQVYAEITGSGKTNKLNITHTISNTDLIRPVIGNIVSIGYLDENGSYSLVTKKMKINGITPNNNEGYQLSLTEYNEDIYKYGTIPDYKSNLTPRPINTINRPVTLEDIQRAENAALDAIQNRNVNIRNLISLDSEGTQNEIATYAGNLYIYNNGEWQPITLAQYLGEYDSDSLPEEVVAGEYFYCSKTFLHIEKLLVNYKQLIVNDLPLVVGTIQFMVGYIYVYDGTKWIQVEDKKNFRYMSTFNQAIKRIPQNLGIFTADPDEAAQLNDWYVYGGTTTTDRKNGFIYILINETNKTWKELDPTKDENCSYYMGSLNNILATQAAGSKDIGYFNVIFSNALMSSAATIGKLQTQTIELQNGGVIKSANYIAGVSGFYIDGDTGYAEFGIGRFKGFLGARLTLHNNVALDTLTAFENVTLCYLYGKADGSLEGMKLLAYFFFCKENYLNIPILYTSNSNINIKATMVGNVPFQRIELTVSVPPETKRTPTGTEEVPYDVLYISYQNLY